MMLCELEGKVHRVGPRFNSISSARARTGGGTLVLPHYRRENEWKNRERSERRREVRQWEIEKGLVREGERMGSETDRQR